ncbi:MAG TPA: hypothetical protein VEI05_03825 [Burkholderiaceae bacterium]|nr:hypothetical protein [Burkholderiaceae bacterium]
MSYLDTDRLAQIAGHASEFLGRKPFPWSILQGVILDSLAGSGLL